ncbi:Scr1 family TA system antitoxin-like transcriptional regulator [Streptomyces sp. ACT015]|uniref:Scr1 family TA system antitoxin-like transcriptional regulator n=1 Tax=Streptomyces sp. ACT015 TaxID=3134807 RepID=UPI003D163F56
MQAHREKTVAPFFPGGHHPAVVYVRSGGCGAAGERVVRVNPDNGYRPPARLVLGVYLRALRESRGELLWATERVGVSGTLVNRWELARFVGEPEKVARVLRFYGVPSDEAHRLVGQFPPRRHRRSESVQGDRFDVFTDHGGVHAWARLRAVDRAASEVVEYAALRLPVSVRTAAYDGWVMRPGPVSAEEGQERFSWLGKVTGNPLQRRTVLLDESVLYRTVGNAALMRRQIRSLVQLVDQEIRDPEAASGMRVRVLPYGARPYPFQDGPAVAAVRVLGRDMVCRPGGPAPVYEAGTQAVLEVSRALTAAAFQEGGPERTRELLVRAAAACPASDEPSAPSAPSAPSEVWTGFPAALS